jgi:hypothetical protein
LLDKILATRILGFLYLFALVTLVASDFFLDKIADLDIEPKLQNINALPGKFKINIMLALIEHVRVIAIALMLFNVFSHHNLLLGVVGTCFRVAEGLILIYNEVNYWSLLSIARQYSAASGADKNALIDLGRTVVETKSSRVTVVQVLFGVGLLAYSILFAFYGVVPPRIGWLGGVSSLILVYGGGIKLVKSTSGVLLGFGSLFAIIFEVILGGWLLFYSQAT